MNKYGTYITALMSTIVDKEQTEFVTNMSWYELNKISTQVSNIKLAQYLKSIPLENKGEMILLISLIHGNSLTKMLDQHTLFFHVFCIIFVFLINQTIK